MIPPESSLPLKTEARLSRRNSPPAAGTLVRQVEIPVNGVSLVGDLALPPDTTGLVLWADGSANGRRSPLNLRVAREINQAGIGTLLFDLLTLSEESKDARTGYWRFDIELLTHRLLQVTKWVQEQAETRHLAIGYFGAGTGSAAALVASARLGTSISAVVSRGGRPDFAGDSLPRVTAPTLLIVGEGDRGILSLNRDAFARLACARELTIVPGASHLFEEAGTLERVASLAATWFQHHLAAGVRR